MPIGVYVRTDFHKKRISSGMVGHTVSAEARELIRNSQLGENNSNWNGGRYLYSGVHHLLRRKNGKAKYCQNRQEQILEFKCKEITDIFDWAKKNNSSYTTNLEDYYQLCRSCHKRYDLGTSS